MAIKQVFTITSTQLQLKKINVGIIGAAGYTGSELIRILLHHPFVSISYVVSNTFAGKKVTQVFYELLGECNLVFVTAPTSDVDIVFLCVAHGAAKTYLEKFPFSANTKIIDLSSDHRTAAPDFVYGLPEWNKEHIVNASKIANPGCFATAIQLGILPLLKQRVLPNQMHINAITGSTGAGKSLSEQTHFSKRTANASVYQVLTHPHLIEINATIASSMQAMLPNIFFVPQRGAFARGIMACISMEINTTLNIEECYNSFYEQHPFTFYIPEPIDLKTVVNTNRCFINLYQKDKQLVVVSYIDNLIKGASGQAVQNMNLMSGYPEHLGLQLKASTY